MKKILLSLLAMSMLTTVALAAEDTVDYGDVTYVYGGQAVETTDDNENGYLDGLHLRGVEEATYYSAGDGFVYYTPATEDAAAILILDNATLTADYGIQSVTDVDVILVGDNLIQTTSEECFSLAAIEAYDSNMELLDPEDYIYSVLTIDGEGSLHVDSSSIAAFVMGQLEIHGGDVSIAMGDSGAVAIELYCENDPDNLNGFLMDGGTLDMDLGQNAAWGIEIFSGDVAISGGALTISGGTIDGSSMLVISSIKDVDISITGGTTVLNNNGEFSFVTGKTSADYSVHTLVDFTDDPEGLFETAGVFHFYDVAEICAGAGTISIPIFDGVAVESQPALTVTGLTGYTYCTNDFALDDLGDETLRNFTASMVGQPTITENVRISLVYPYTTEDDYQVSFAFTRAQIIALLWDSMGCPEATMDNPFTDVSPENNYYTAILWAVEQGITTGTTDTTFAPDALCTKGQLLTFLYRNAGQPEVDVENVFADVDESSYLYDAVLWGIANTMMDMDAETFDATNTELSDGAIAYLICMYE